MPAHLFVRRQQSVFVTDSRSCGTRDELARSFQSDPAGIGIAHLTLCRKWLQVRSVEGLRQTHQSRRTSSPPGRIATAKRPPPERKPSCRRPLRRRADSPAPRPSPRGHRARALGSPVASRARGRRQPQRRDGSQGAARLSRRHRRSNSSAHEQGGRSGWRRRFLT